MSKTLSIKDLIKKHRINFPVLKGKHILKKINAAAKNYSENCEDIKK